MIPLKHHFWSFLAITIAVFQIQMILTLIPLHNEHDGMRICAKHSNYIQSGNEFLKHHFWSFLAKTIAIRVKMIPRKHHFWSFLAITIAVCQIQMILTVIPLQNQHVRMGLCAKQTNFIQSG